MPATSLERTYASVLTSTRDKMKDKPATSALALALAKFKKKGGLKSKIKGKGKNDKKTSRPNPFDKSEDKPADSTGNGGWRVSRVGMGFK